MRFVWSRGKRKAAAKQRDEDVQALTRANEEAKTRLYVALENAVLKMAPPERKKIDD